MRRSNNFLLEWWRLVDQQLVIALLILFGFSLILVTTSGSMVAARIGLAESYFSVRQPFYLSLAALIILILSSLDQRLLKRIAVVSFIMNLFLLSIVKFYGYEVKGAIRWISIAGISIQPSEFIKPLFAAVTGWLLSLKSTDNFPAFSVCSVLYCIIAALLITQPDFGMLVMITVIYCIQLFVAGLPIFWLICACLLSVFGVSMAYIYLPHAAQRINGFLDPNSHENYQVSKSIKAFEHGGFYGRGPGEGAIKQSLPDSHTDFIFAVAGEEFGAIICLIIIGVFTFIVIRCLWRLVTVEDKFVQLSVLGIVSQFGMQSVINMGVALNLLPTKGMTLPFISYGGSSTIALGIGMGMILGLLKRSKSIRIQPDIVAL